MDELIITLHNYYNNYKLSYLIDYFTNIDIPIDQNFVIFNEQSYSKNLVYSTDNYDIYYICWKKGQCSKIHDHPKNGCLMKILSGKLKETKYDIHKKIISENTLQINDVGYMEGNKIIHKIEALDDTISVHIYAPSSYIANIYN